MNPIEQAARAEADRRFHPNTYGPHQAELLQLGFTECASWLAERLLSDESVEKAARALYEEVGVGQGSAAWAEWDRISNSRRDRGSDALGRQANADRRSPRGRAILVRMARVETPDVVPNRINACLLDRSDRRVRGVEAMTLDDAIRLAEYAIQRVWPGPAREKALEDALRALLDQVKANERRKEVRELPTATGPCRECRRTDGTHKMSCSAGPAGGARLSMRMVDGELRATHESSEPQS